MVEATKKHYNAFGPYRLGKTIGQGEFGKVKYGIHVKNGNEVAVKLIRKDSIQLPAKRQKLVREIKILQQLDHRFIVKLHEVLETESYIGMVMEFASGGELFGHILAKKYLKEPEAGKFFTQLIVGVSYLHSKGIVHRDLKLENLLLDSNRNIIITDFGFANRFTIDSDELLSTSCGSPCYAAPELVVNESYVGEAADIWSCGVILYAMLCGYLPFDDDPRNADGDNINLLYKYILETKLQFPSHVSSLAKSLVNRILVTDPMQRAQMPEIKSHRWLEPFKSIFMEEEEINPTVVKDGLEPLEENSIATVPTAISVVEIEPKATNDEELLQPPTIESDVKSEFSATPSVSTNPATDLLSVQTEDFQRSSFDAPGVQQSNSYGKRAQSMDNPDRKFAIEESKMLRKTYINLDEEFEALQAKPNPFYPQSPKPTVIAQNLKFHHGPIDPKALSSMSPDDILERILDVARTMSLTVVRTDNCYKLKILRNYEDLEQSTTDLSVEYQDKRRPKFGNISKYPNEIIQRIKYMGMFGLNYNHGYTGTTSVIPKDKVSPNGASPIKAYIVIHQIKNLKGLYTVDIKRARGDIWEFKQLYMEFIKHLDFGIQK